MQYEAREEIDSAEIGRRGIVSYQWVILAVAVLTQAAVGAVSQGVPVLASFYRVELNLSSTQVGTFTAVLSLGAVFVATAAGWITDRFGVKPIFLLGPLLVGGSIFMLSTATSFAFALAFGFLAGIGHSLTNPSIAKAILYWFSLKRRATAMGVKQTGIPLSGTLAASILPAVALAFNWRYAMAALGVIVMACGLMVFALYRDPRSGPLSHKTRKAPSLKAIVSIMMDKNNWLVCALAGTLIGGQYCVVTYLILYLKDVLLFSPAVAGGFLAFVQLSGLGARVFLGALSDFVLGGRRKVVLVSCGFLAVAILAAVGTLGAGVPGLVLPLLMAALGVSIIGWHGIWITMMSESAPVETAGTSVGFGCSCRSRFLPGAVWLRGR